MFDLLGNVIIIHIVRTRPHMRSKTNMLISNLAFADILMVPTCLYMTKHLFVGYKWFGGASGLVSCKVASSITLVSSTSSVYTILLIAVERFFAIVSPLSKPFHRKHVAVSISLIWLGALACSIPESMMVTIKPCSAHAHCCIGKGKQSPISYIEYTTSIICVTYIVPLVAISTLYCITGYKLWISKAPAEDTRVVKQTRQLKRKAIRMLVIVVAVFALCWLPLYAAEVLKMYKRRFYYNSVPIEVQFILPWFGVANSAINPYFFPIFCEKFRREFRAVLCCAPKISRLALLSQVSTTTKESRKKSSLPIAEFIKL